MKSPKFAVFVVAAALMMAGCAVSSDNYRDAVEESVSNTDAYEVEYVNTKPAGLFGLENEVSVSVIFPSTPSEAQIIQLVSDVTSPYPAGAESIVHIWVDTEDGSAVDLSEIIEEPTSPPFFTVGTSTLAGEVSSLRSLIEQQ